MGRAIRADIHRGPQDREHRGVGGGRYLAGGVTTGALFLAAPRPGQSPLFGPAPAPAPSPRGKLTPARPRIYYRWKDARGTLHVAQNPPGDGVSYTMIRALD